MPASADLLHFIPNHGLSRGRQTHLAIRHVSYRQP